MLPYKLITQFINIMSLGGGVNHFFSQFHLILWSFN